VHGSQVFGGACVSMILLISCLRFFLIARFFNLISALCVVRYNKKAVPIVWNSTLVLDGDDPQPFAVCRRGNPEDCQEGLLNYDYGGLFDPEYRRCSILTREFCSSLPVLI